MTLSDEPILIVPVDRRPFFPEPWEVRQLDATGEPCHSTTHRSIDEALLMVGVLMRKIEQRRTT